MSTGACRARSLSIGRPFVHGFAAQSATRHDDSDCPWLAVLSGCRKRAVSIGAKSATAWRVDATLVTPTSAKLTNDAKQQLMPAQGAHMKHGMAQDKNDLHP